MAVRALVDYGRLLDAIGVEAEVLVAAAHQGVPDAAVPACPGLTLGETVRHVGSVYRLATGWLREGRRPGRWQRWPQEGESAVEYLREGLWQLQRELEAVPPERPCSTWWSDDETYGFWRRRMAHETIVHRSDVQHAAAVDPSSISEDLALDGIDEVLTLWLGRRLDMLGVTGTSAAAVLVRAADRRWLTRSGPEGASAVLLEPDEQVNADATINGAPEDVYLWLWGRLPDRSVDRAGDDDSVAALWALLRLATR